MAHYVCYTLTWRHGIDTVEEKLSSVQYRGGQGLIAAHFSLKILTTRPLNHITHFLGVWFGECFMCDKQCT